MSRKPLCECGECKTCLHREYQRKHTQKKREAKLKSVRIYPAANVVTIWECSDGREFTSQVDALEHELNLFRKG